MPRLFTLAVAAVALAAGIAATPASAAAPQREPEPVALTGAVTLSGSVAGYVPVKIARTARIGNPFFQGRKDSVRISSGGRLAGFALVRDGNMGAAVIGWRSQDIAREQIPYLFDIGRNPESRRDGKDYVLSPGSYRLYLFTGGKPTTVSLKFAGLTGTSRWSPVVRTATILNADKPRLDPKDTGFVYSAGHEVRLPGPALFVDVFAMRTSAHTESSNEYCFFLGKPTGPNPYLPGCPSTDGNVGQGSRLIYSDENVDDRTGATYASAFVIKTNAAGSDFGAGLSVTTASVVTDTDYAQMWILLDPPK